MQRNILNIAGSDTEIGKTTVASLLTRKLCELGVQPWVMKPVQTDCTRDADGNLSPSDAISLWEASGRKQTLDEVILYRYLSPVAPLVAARAEKQPINYSRILGAIEAASEKSKLVIYEGTGGILVPLTAEKNFLDLARETKALNIVVVGSRLGAINHAALTFRTLRAEGLPCLGYVFNDLFAVGDNLDSAAKFPADAISTNRALLAEVAADYGFEELAALPYLRERYDGLPLVENLARAVLKHFELAN